MVLVWGRGWGGFLMEQGREGHMRGNHWILSASQEPAGAEGKEQPVCGAGAHFGVLLLLC